MGAYFERYGRIGIAEVIKAISDGDLSQATQELLKMDADGQAAARRFAVGVCTEMLVEGEPVRVLGADARAKAKAGLARRRAMQES